MNERPIDNLRSEIITHPTTLDLVSSLMNDNDIEMKTEIINPYALDTLRTFARYFKMHSAKSCSDLLKYWIKYLLKYMISHDRLSRVEITEILKGYFSVEREKEKQLTLTSNLAKINEQSSF